MRVNTVMARISFHLQPSLIRRFFAPCLAKRCPARIIEPHADLPDSVVLRPRRSAPERQIPARPYEARRQMLGAFRLIPALQLISKTEIEFTEDCFVELTPSQL